MIVSSSFDLFHGWQRIITLYLRNEYSTIFTEYIVRPLGFDSNGLSGVGCDMIFGIIVSVTLVCWR